MSEFSITDAAFAGFRIVQRKPLAVLAWGLTYAVFIGLLVLLFGGSIAALALTIGKSGAAAPRPEQLLGLVGGMVGFVLLLILGLMVIGAMVQAAVIRAVLEPENDRFGYLRFGSQELWVLAVSFVQWIVLVIFQVVISVPVGIVTGVMAVTARDAAAVVSGIGQIAVYAASIWLSLRLSLGLSMSFHERQFRLFESWTLTRGHTLQLFLMALLMALVVGAIYIVVAVVGVGAGVALIGSLIKPDAAAAFFNQPPGQLMGAFAPLLVLAGVLLVLVGGALAAITSAPFAHAYRQLRPEADVAATFA